MPLTWVEPPASAPFGPGFVINATSDFIGPLATGSYWEATLFDSDLVNAVGVTTETAFSTHFVATFGYDYRSNTISLNPIIGSTRGGQTGRLQVKLRAPDGTELDSGERSVVMNHTDGIQYMQGLRDAISTTGLTPTDRANIELAATNTQLRIPQVGAPGGGVITSIASFFSQLPAHFVNRHGSILISGVGSLARGTEPFRVDSQGIEWHWHTIPAGFGRNLGSVDEYGRRIVQFRGIDEDSSGQLFQSFFTDAVAEGVRYEWGIHNPVTLEYFVAPGCVVELSFLVPLLG